MFHKIINNKRDLWYESSDCKIQEIIRYIHDTGKLRDAQYEAIKTYLFLKIACCNRPLYDLFISGYFNSLNLDDIALNVQARKVLTENKAAAALFEYSRLTDRNGRQLAPELERHITQNTADIDYRQVFKEVFYGVSYTDYLFSLPMGAGKTFLMAAFIYIDLYFALIEPDNKSFAHNFMIFAPSGLKSSILPSLKHIQEFDPSWIIPEPTASQIKNMICFEILDEQKSANKSNRTRNPNAQKLNSHQPFDNLMGLVAITNAEKVILDRIDTDQGPRIFSDDELRKIASANELRSVISQIPDLAIYIDEVHHAADGEIKLRKVVNEWTSQGTINCVLGFSGTPYLEKAENIVLGDNFSIKNTDLSNVVYHYPLIDGIGNFLKDPVVKYTDCESEVIVRKGTEEFLEQYKDTIYPNGTKAKLAIYCGQIEPLEEVVYPLVCEIAESFGLDPKSTILKYHGGNSKYPQPSGAQTEFAALDTSFSEYRIILLAQIGKEGWDCKSLTSVILPQKGACPTNMVLQTSCRCLRQVCRNSDETALIWMNKFNAETLNKQLKQQQNISLQEFNNTRIHKTHKIDRYSRMDYLEIPPVHYYQLKVTYRTQVTESAEGCHVSERLKDISILAESDISIISEMDMSGAVKGHYEDYIHHTESISFLSWLTLISKESFNTLPISRLLEFEAELSKIFHTITLSDGHSLYLSSSYDHEQIRANIRKAFTPRRKFVTEEQTIPETASLLHIEKLNSPIEASEEEIWHPSSETIENIIKADQNPASEALSPKVQAALEVLKAAGQDISSIQATMDRYPERKRTYHYLPYHFDSPFEKSYFEDILRILEKENLELYFNGDNTLTGFKIDCYRKEKNEWRRIGKYTPDFLLIQRNENKDIHKVIIIETKGKGYADSFMEKKEFMEGEFLKLNNEAFGYKRFHFLYIEDSMTSEDIRKQTLKAIRTFFKE